MGTLTIADWLMLIAVLLGPILAVITQLWFQRRTEKRNLKLYVFGTLMNLRATPLSPDFVKALNYIDVVFYENENVRKRWITLLDYLGTGTATFDRIRDLTAQMLAEMANDLDYKFDHVHIKEKAYWPQAHGELDEQGAELRKLGIAVLKGESRVKVVIDEDRGTATATTTR